MALSAAEVAPESAPVNSPLKADVVVSVETPPATPEKTNGVEKETLKTSSSDVSEASASSTNSSPSKGSPSKGKPSILRNNRLRLRRRKRPSEAQVVAAAQIDAASSLEENQKETEDSQSTAQALPPQQQQQHLEQVIVKEAADENDVEEAKLESVASNEEDDGDDAASQQAKISIVLAHDNEVVIEQLLPHSAAKTSNNEANVPEQPEHFYSPLKLLSPPQKRSSTASATAQPKGIIKRRSSTRLSSSSLASLGAPTQCRRVSFDEATIVKQERKKKSLEGLRMAMPIILPYLIAVLILILSSLVPPATPPPMKQNDVATKGFMSKFVTVSDRSHPETRRSNKAYSSPSRVFSSPSPSPFVGDKNETGVPSLGHKVRQNLSEALWTPHSIYDRVVSTSKANSTGRR